MGTEVEAWCRAGDEKEGLRSWFEVVESVCSRFRSDSELSLINNAANTTHQLSPILAEVLGAAHRARSLTGGLVEIGVGSAVSAWGYDRTFAEVTGRDTPPQVLPAPAWKVDQTILIRSSDTVLDLGGVAKGWTCDQAVEQGLGAVVSAGGDLRSADDDTTVSVLDPWGGLAARVHVGKGALATSSVSRRRWTVSDREVSHLIDPRTMTPVTTPVLSATVVAATAVDAEAGAKAVLLLGEDGLAWADEQNWINGAIVVWHDGSVFATTGVEVAA